MHRDIKPSNILLESKHKIVLSDFGLAKEYEVQDLCSTICGSPLYMAPELLYHKNYSPNCDIWSIGIVLYEMLFNKVPFLANSIESLKKKIIIKCDIPNNISEPCRNLLEKLLIHDSNKRITWNELFQHKWILSSDSLDNILNNTSKEKYNKHKVEQEKDIHIYKYINPYFFSDESSDIFVVDDLYM